MLEPSHQMQIAYKHATTKADFEAAKQLLIEYANSLGFDLKFQDFATELNELATRYNQPRGDLIMAYVDGELAGAVAVHEFEPGIAEMKRLYVRNGFRQLGIGRELVARILVSAKELGYRSIRLDTLKEMQGALKIYRAAGFKTIDSYRFNPLDGAEYLELQLR
ncbi:N-acetyltransferase GCN5 [Lentilactobacillus rapi DSM 19907 = JCM 15042]|uniref:Acetyltransferase CD1211 n=2 Tax=Lentilactobacillus rapi TaxID=481723 RepID=A0A512PR11_9LACO|nr:GNAT family N-acetyltransferase [Lentilactobacillus rapi]KRL16528.1 N-acetyltransferase GCN5 [Lentilactobacillus rapi DSM 19907 = JCM 15042]GEP73624.1 acetyltransferase CD1211 [Lentilactobacillus rapi]